MIYLMHNTARRYVYFSQNLSIQWSVYHMRYTQFGGTEKRRFVKPPNSEYNTRDNGIFEKIAVDSNNSLVIHAD